ncbi:MAG: FAD-dependent oxidoreductase [Candidatus Bathyarchaeia archaeon]
MVTTYRKLHSIEDFNNLRKKILTQAALDKRLKVKVHLGTCGLSAGALDVWKKFYEEITFRKLEKKVALSKAGCAGFCSLEPNVTIYDPLTNKNVIYKEVTPEKVQEIIDEHILNGHPIERYTISESDPYLKLQVRRVLRNQDINPMSIEDYIARDGYLALIKALTKMPPEDVISEVERSGLRGRGGAGFKTGLKWKFARAAKGYEKYVVCNADEGDPGAYMNRAVLEGNPHSVIEGLTIAGYAIGAKQGYIYVRAEYPLAVETLEHAIKQAREYGLLGKNILGTNFDFDIDICLGAGAFVCGEETALIASLMGKRGSPRPRPPFPAEKGLLNKPTVINNVETLSIVPSILLYGADWFKEVGSERSPGTKTFCLVGKIQNSGVVEVPLGTPLGKIVFDIGGGPKNKKKFKAVLIGGPSGGCLSAEHLNVSVEYDTVDMFGAIMGSGGLVVLDEDDCMVDIARFFLEFTKDESCGKCTPCRAGIPQMLELLDKIRRGEGTIEDLNRLEELAIMIKTTSLCGLGQTAPNPVLTTLRYFRNEYEAHIKEKKCPAVVCQALFKSPCQHTCPVNLNIPGYISLIKEGRIEDAYKLIKQRLPFPSICGRVCHAPCEKKCRRSQIDEAMAIKYLKKFVADWAMEKGLSYTPPTSKKKTAKVAVVGAGPAGLSCAYYLATYGYSVVVFEASNAAGGLLRWGIPEYRLPKKILQKEIQEIEKLGVKIRFNSRVESLDKLFSEGFKAIFIATGASRSIKLNLPGENLEGVYDAIEFLKKVNSNEEVALGKRVAIIGGGNAAIDSARVALRKGAEAHLFYRRERKDMPAIEEEIEAAEKEGVKIHCLTTPIEIIGENGKVKAVKLTRMSLGEFDKSARKTAHPIPGSEFIFEVDNVIKAVGQAPDTSFLQEQNLKLTKEGWVLVDPQTMMTSRIGVFAGGDIVTGPATVIEAIAAGIKAANSIKKFLEGEEPKIEQFETIKIPSTLPSDEEMIEKPRIEPIKLPLAEAVKSFNEVVKNYTFDMTVKESKRCLRCDLEVE